MICCAGFSNGCSIGCDACDGSTRGPIPKFRAAADGKLEPVMNQTDSALCRKLGKGPSCFPGAKEPICPNPAKATVCDVGQRTVNLGAECGAPDDFYYMPTSTSK